MHKTPDDVLAAAVAKGAVPGIVALAANADRVTFQSLHGHTGPHRATPLDGCARYLE